METPSRESLANVEIQELEGLEASWNISREVSTKEASSQDVSRVSPEAGLGPLGSCAGLYWVGVMGKFRAWSNLSADAENAIENGR